MMPNVNKISDVYTHWSFCHLMAPAAQTLRCCRLAPRSLLWLQEEQENFDTSRRQFHFHTGPISASDITVQLFIKQKYATSSVFQQHRSLQSRS